MTDTVKYVLDESRIPKTWYNLQADLPKPPPPVLHPGTLQAARPGRSRAALPDGADHAGGVDRARDRDPRAGARRLPAVAAVAAVPRAAAREGAADAGADLLQVRGRVARRQPQAEHRGGAGVLQQARPASRSSVTETGAGQWGSSLAFAGALFGIEVQVFMVRVSYDQKPYRRALMETYGARCIASPSNETQSGRAILAQRADHPGSLGIAISEAVEVAAQRDDTKYALGSVLNHVLLHQTVIGQEAMAQLEMAGDYPGRDRRLHRRRLELRRHRVPVPRRAAARREEGAHRRGRARGLPEPHARQVRLRLRRHRRT